VGRCEVGTTQACCFLSFCFSGKQSKVLQTLEAKD
jgi:hypothetical protein